jgi:hypothetical protein
VLGLVHAVVGASVAGRGGVSRDPDDGDRDGERECGQAGGADEGARGVLHDRFLLSLRAAIAAALP